MKYEEINIGDKAEIHHTISYEDIQTFAGLTGDDNQLHMNEKYAAKTSFRKPVVHGMLSASFISTIIGTRIPGDGALWYEQHLEFLLPVRIGDQITISATVINKIDRLKAIELKTDITNQDKQLVIAGKAKVKIVERETEKANEEAITSTPVFLIVGATGGIGSATAKKLAERKCTLVLHYNTNKQKAEELKHTLEKISDNRILLVTGDVSNTDSVANLFSYINDRVGPLTGFVHAGTSAVPNITLGKLEWEDFTKHINIHVKGFFNLIQEFNKQAVNYGKIVAISSQTTDYPFNDLAPYTTAKAALEGLAKSMAVDLAKKGIRVNVISPGITMTDLNANLPEKAKLLAAAKTPLKRLALPEDVANTISYLLWPESDFLTGETIRLNGGVVMN